MRAYPAWAWVLTLVGLLAGSGVIPPASVAGQSAPQDYTAEYNTAALYPGYALLYEFGDLDDTVEYTWRLQQLDNRGNPIGEWATWSIGPGVTEGMRYHTGWPHDAHGPMRLVDHWGQVLGHHFITPYPGEPWIESHAEDQLEKVGIGKVVYQPINGDGYQHDRAGAGSIVKFGDYTLLHYRASIGTTDRIHVRDVADGSLLAVYDIGEMADFNDGGGSSASAFIWRSYVVLSTNGVAPRWVDTEKSAAAFTAGSNPHIAVYAPGVYEYARVESDSTPVSSGESLLLVSRDPTGNEWLLGLRGRVSPGDEQELRLRAHTPEIWDSLNVRWIQDSALAGVVDITDDWVPLRRDAHNVSDSPALMVTTGWCFAAESLTWADPPERVFCALATYEISDATGIIGPVRRLLHAFNLDDDLGRLGVLVLMMGLTTTLLRRLPGSSWSLVSAGLYSLLAWSGFALITGWITGWVALVLGFVMIGLVIILVMGMVRD